jgi:tetratricopeptide (TPR) repeat protein/predicted Ser/Thr protein kinase
MAPDPGPQIGPYRVIRRLGAGGMGTVLLAEDVRLRRPVALKTISDPENVTPQARQRLLHEARAAAALSHPHIAAVHDVLDADGQIVIVFEYVEGETLAATLRSGPLPVARAVEVACELADALDAAHAHGIVHRDLKPANIALSAKGRTVVLDFGIARILPTAEGTTTLGDSASGAGGLIGTPGYAAPEQWAGQHADARSDLYSLGVVLFEMIAGRRPFEEPDVMALGQAVVTRRAPRLSSVVRVPHDLDVLVSALLAQGPGDRPQSAREVIEALRPIRTGLGASPAAHVPAARWQRKDRMRRRGFAAAGLLGAAALVPMLLWQGGDRPPPDARPPVVAILPLSMAGAEGGEDYLAAGIAESLIVRLAAVPSITVLSRAAVADARALQPDLRRLSRDLDAAYLVETGVQQSGDRLRITLNLVRRDGSVAWADSFEGTFERIFDLQVRIVTAVSQALQVRVSAEERKRFDEQPTTSPEALEAYWRGRGLLERRDVAGNLEGAVEAFSEAVRLDPRFALAHAALGEAYWVSYETTRDPQWVPRATEAGMLALRLAPDQAPVRYSLALTLAGSGRLGEAVEELERALLLQPNYDDARRRLGQVRASQGRIDEAVEEFRKAIALRPSFWGHWGDMGLALYQAARYAEAADAFAHVTKLQPDNHLGFQQLGTVYHAMGDVKAAIREYERSIVLRPSAGAYTNIGALYHAEGRFEQAVDAYRHSLELRESAVTYRNLGDAYAKMGRQREAREAYGRAVATAEGELQVNPRDARNLAALAVYLAKRGDHPAALQRLGEALEIAADDVQVLYRAAVVHALAGRAEPALSALDQAIRAGYSGARAADDEDLSSLRRLPAFAAVVDLEQKGQP